MVQKLISNAKTKVLGDNFDVMQNLLDKKISCGF